MVINNRKSVKILFADDDADDYELFQQALKEVLTDAEVIPVTDGDKLVKYLAEVDVECPDIIFLDMRMPCKNGNECLQEIRSNAKFSKVPVVIFSTSAAKRDIDETFSNGANLFVLKPVYFHHEVEILKKIFSLDWKEELLKPDKESFVLYSSDIK